MSEESKNVSHLHILLEQYKIYVEMADRISNRRQITNSFYLALNAALTSFYGVVATQNDTSVAPAFLFVFAVAGIVICYTWSRGIRAYGDINSGKFHVIHEIEKSLPTAPYTKEWDRLGRGENKRVYVPFTTIERRVPWIFMVLYISLMALTTTRLLHPHLDIFDVAPVSAPAASASVCPRPD